MVDSPDIGSVTPTLSRLVDPVFAHLGAVGDRRARGRRSWRRWRTWPTRWTQWWAPAGDDVAATMVSAGAMGTRQDRQGGDDRGHLRWGRSGRSFRGRGNPAVTRSKEISSIIVWPLNRGWSARWLWKWESTERSKSSENIRDRAELVRSGRPTGVVDGNFATHCISQWDPLGTRCFRSTPTKDQPRGYFAPAPSTLVPAPGERTIAPTSTPFSPPLARCHRRWNRSDSKFTTDEDVATTH